MFGHILLVDEQSELLGQWSATLEAAGHSCVSAQSSREALLHLAGSAFDLVLCDLAPTERSGLNLLRKVKSLSPMTEVILVTEESSLSLALEGFREGAFDFLEKPLPPEKLTPVVQRALEHRQVRLSTDLFQTSQVIFSTSDPEALPQVVVEVAMKIMEADDASLMLPNEQGKLRVAYSHALSEDDLGQLPRTRSNIAKKVAREKSPALISGQVSKDPRFEGEDGNKRVESSIVYPLHSGDRLVGVLNLNRTGDKTPFRRGDMETAAILASQAVLALENTRLVRELRGRIADLEEAQHRLVHSERLAAIGQMAAGVVHEINNPTSYLLANLVHISEGLEAICGLGDILNQTPLQEPLQAWHGSDALEALQDLAQATLDAKDGAERIRDIAKDLRLMARTDPGKHSLIDLNEVMNSSLRVARLSMGQSVAWRSQSNGPVTVLGNSRRLSQVFVNLLVNAAQAASQVEDREPWVEFRLSAQNDRAVVEVEDCGLGISEEHIGRIFEPFFTTKEGESGTGLGLSISRDIIHRHKGEIQCRSQPLEGTTFTIDLPLASPEG